MMPLLILLAACVAVYSITRPGAVEGIKYFLIPNLENFSWMTVVAAMGQMFYSLSIAMGILYTYGSYIDVYKRQVRLYPSLQFCLDIGQLKQVMAEFVEQEDFEAADMADLEEAESEESDE